TDAAALVAHFFGRPRRDVAWGEIAVTRVFPFQIVIAAGLENPARRLAAILFLLGHPNTAIVAQRFRHQREFRLMVAADRDASGMDLCVARIRESRALLVGAPGRRDVAAFGVGREKENVSVTAGREHHGVAGMGGYFAADQIPHDDAF